ncbi:hypothetical protein SCHPADRAFT_193352 [Schizopora paradoxa]|uniref:Uncharacterized protein n=1 Tax=Schizopora paradoxa TaxID=27342 RepID=A0A0H2RYI5_9AGAM|nr:hypothetical protein SCHPADRAFT_193352 [Schizopora paradoxa]
MPGHPNPPEDFPPGTHLRGTLSQVTKQNLVRLANHFGLNSEGGCDGLRTRIGEYINEHFDHFVNLPRYATLFPANRRQQQPPPPPPPPAMRRRRTGAPLLNPRQHDRRSESVSSGPTVFAGFDDEEPNAPADQNGDAQNQQQPFPDVPARDGEHAQNEMDEESDGETLEHAQTPRPNARHRANNDGAAASPTPTSGLGRANGNAFEDIPEGEFSI